MSMAYHIIIPARYHSSRLVGKLLMDIHGQSVIERVYRQAVAAKATSVTIATDSELIAEAAADFSAPVLMTSQHHQTGSDRIAEAVSQLGFASDDIIVNVQGDEPFISPELIQQVASNLSVSTAPMATLCWPIENLSLLQNPNVVKVVRDCNNQALYFSRSPIPNNRDNPEDFSHVFRHIGLYAYRAKFLLDMVTWPPCTLETIECLEQLRVLWLGHKIQVNEACVKPLQDINTAEDLELARLQIS